MIPKLTIASLTGGLGNQLFILAEAMSHSSEEIIITPCLGKPRRTNGIPDLLHFNLPKEIKYKWESDASWLVRKSAGFVLRKGIEKRSLEKFDLVNTGLDLLAKLIISTHFSKLLTLNVAEDIGFSIKKSAKSEILIGYFQHHLNLEIPDLFNKLMEIRPIHFSEALNLKIQEANLRKPIFVHYRLADYLLEENFGTPSLEYYESSLESLAAKDREIWVFSDQVALAKERFPKKFIKTTKFIEDLEFNPAQTMHLFRFGYDYVIANSSFSWWGASLRVNREAMVVVPDPWFKGIKDPNLLFPSSWIRGKSGLN